MVYRFTEILDNLLLTLSSHVHHIESKFFWNLLHRLLLDFIILLKIFNSTEIKVKAHILIASLVLAGETLSLRARITLELILIAVDWGLFILKLALALRISFS